MKQKQNQIGFTKPFGFCIHARIDGYSRRILWLEVGVTNNDPDVTAAYFLDCIRSVGGVPRILRADNGTENVNLAAIQRFFEERLWMCLLGKRALYMASQCLISASRRGGAS